MTKASRDTISEFPQHARKFAHLIAVAVVSDIGAGALPSNTFLVGPLRVEEWSHTVRVQTVALHQVDDRSLLPHITPACELSEGQWASPGFRG